MIGWNGGCGTAFEVQFSPHILNRDKGDINLKECVKSTISLQESRVCYHEHIRNSTIPYIDK